MHLKLVCADAFFGSPFLVYFICLGTNIQISVTATYKYHLWVWFTRTVNQFVLKKETHYLDFLPFLRWKLRKPDLNDLRFSQDGPELWEIFHPSFSLIPFWSVDLYRKHLTRSSSLVTKATSRLPIK